ncbi:hypothetical protein SAMN05428970_2898 [Agromyces sp. CF514]|uniref:TFIIB-type zinc ribbon-containing protein n=1 Tax=Agromyces sp. CF514 TaxID=1881031 RepID=UPI0008E0E280|nr:zf-TFIIB domain-containing protein [Agromyces sp. CF514]SFR83968.1 hypothetical protein SAMN05428970_2898 [Agromyces sp. CF514]
MHCPNDGAVLVMSERSGIEIDYCPTCRGVWLDRGELDKIIERSSTEFGRPAAVAPPAVAPTPPPAAAVAPPAAAPTQPGYQYGQQSYDSRVYDTRGYGDQGSRKKKKDNWLSDLFD